MHSVTDNTSHRRVAKLSLADDYHAHIYIIYSTHIIIFGAENENELQSAFSNICNASVFGADRQTVNFHTMMV